MNNIQMKNEIPDTSNDTVKLAFSVTFDDGTTISDGAIVISRADWLNMTGKQKSQSEKKQICETISISKLSLTTRIKLLEQKNLAKH